MTDLGRNGTGTIERIHKILARAGIASRRHAEELIRQGRVEVNGERAVIGQRADPVRDRITVDGKPVRIERKVYYALYKPKCVVTTMGEEHGQKTIAHLPGIKVLKERVFPVGRLDKDAEGLLLLTNDGDFANRISHPRYEIAKEYHVQLDRPFEDSENLLKGVMIDGWRVEVGNLRCRETRVVLSIHEGRKHIVKRVFEKLGYDVRDLKRTRIGSVRLGKLKPGELRPLGRDELKMNGERIPRGSPIG